jgi:hypothetical protein
VNSSVQTGSGAHPTSYPIGAFSLGVKRPRREADHSPPSRPEIKKAWIYIFTPLIRLHGVALSYEQHRDNFTVYCL